MSTDNQHHICLIGGTGRSGTTVFKRIFNQHPDAVGIREFRITLDPDGLIDTYRSLCSHWSPYLFDRKISRLRSMLLDAARSNSLAKYYRHGLRKLHLSKGFRKLELRYTDIGLRSSCPDYEERVEKLITDLTDFSFTGSWTGQHFGEKNRIRFSSYPDPEQLAARLGLFYRRITGTITNQADATHFLDDNTWNILYFPDLLELLPDARLVHVYRDPRDVTASFMEQSWAPSDPIQAATFCKSILDRWQTVQQRVKSDKYRELALETLVRDPKSALQRISNFWNLEWDDSLLDLKLNRAHTGRWKRDIPEQAQKQVHDILADQLETYGYE